MMDEFDKRLTALEAKHQQETAGYPISKKLIRFVKRQQQTMTNAKIPDSVVANMPESQQQGTSNNSNEIQYGIVDNRQQATMAAAASFTLIPPPPITPNLAACHSAVRTTWELGEGIFQNMNDISITQDLTKIIFFFVKKSAL
jgi:hypothetical protein